MGASVELGQHMRIHCNHHLLFLSHQDISFFDLIVDPSLEVIPDHCSTDIDNPLLWNLWQVRCIRQIVSQPWVTSGEAEDVFKFEVLILGHMQGLDIVVVQIRLLPIQDALEKVDGDIV